MGEREKQEDGGSSDGVSDDEDEAIEVEKVEEDEDDVVLVQLKKEITNSVCFLLQKNFKYGRNSAGIILHPIHSANRMSTTKNNCRDHEEVAYTAKSFLEQDYQWKFNPTKRVDL